MTYPQSSLGAVSSASCVRSKPDDGCAMYCQQFNFDLFLCLLTLICFHNCMACIVEVILFQELLCLAEFDTYCCPFRYYVSLCFGVYDRGCASGFVVWKFISEFVLWPCASGFVVWKFISEFVLWPCVSGCMPALCVSWFVPWLCVLGFVPWLCVSGCMPSLCVSWFVPWLCVLGFDLWLCVSGCMPSLCVSWFVPWLCVLGFDP